MSFLSCVCCLGLHHAARHFTKHFCMHQASTDLPAMAMLSVYTQAAALHTLIITNTCCYDWFVCAVSIHQQQHAVLHPCAFGTSCPAAVPAEHYLCSKGSITMLCNTEPNHWQGTGFWDPLLGTRDGRLGPLGTGRLAPQGGCCGFPLLSCWATASPPSPCSSLPP